MSLQSYFMFNVSHSSEEKASSGSSKIDYVERKEMDEDKDGTAKSEIDYIERQQTLAKNTPEAVAEYKNDFMGSISYNMPKWAEELAVKNGSRPSKEFFKASEKLEPAGWNHWHEIKLTIPNECTFDDAVKIGVKIMNENGLGNYAYTIAGHDKTSSLSKEIKKDFSSNSDGEIRNKHIHIVFSDRKPDGIDRPIEKYFKQFTPKDPRRGGCQKDTRFTTTTNNKNINSMLDIRFSSAKIINEFYTQNGIDKHVDPRTKDDQFLDAYKKGDYDLCEILAVENQEHLGAHKASDINNPDTQKVIALKQKVQDIKDRQLIEKMNSEDTQYEKLDKKELNEQIKTIDAKIQELSKKMPDVVLEGILAGVEDKEQLKTIAALEKTIEQKRGMISTNIKKSALRSYLKSQDKLELFFSYTNDLKDLEKSNKEIDRKEKLFANREIKNTQTTPQEFEYLNSLKRTKERLLKQIKAFEAEHTNNERYKMNEKQVLANNIKLENLITKLENSRDELIKTLPPEVKEKSETQPQPQSQTDLKQSPSNLIPLTKYYPKQLPENLQSTNAETEYLNHVEAFKKMTGATITNPLIDTRIARVMITKFDPKIVSRAIANNTTTKGAGNLSTQTRVYGENILIQATGKNPRTGNAVSSAGASNSSSFFKSNANNQPVGCAGGAGCIPTKDMDIDDLIAAGYSHEQAAKILEAKNNSINIQLSCCGTESFLQEIGKNFYKGR